MSDKGPFEINFDAVLTRDVILAKVSEEEIFTRYGVRVQEGVFRSPLRKDRHPTMMFYRRNNGKLILRDYAGSFWGDCFDLVQATQPVKTFGQALKLVAEDFGLTNEIVLRDRIPITRVEIPVLEATSIKIKRREWNEEDKKYWGRWNFKRETLEFFEIAPIERAWINDESVYAYRKKGQEAYAYHFIGYNFKLYFPYRSSTRFMHNNSWIMQGWAQLPESGPFVVITKSLKDVAKLYEFGIPAVAPMSETTLPSRDYIEALSLRFPRIIVLYDNDWPGRRQTMRFLRKFRDEFSLECLLFPQNMPKDFTDYYEQKGQERTNDLIDYVKTELSL